MGNADKADMSIHKQLFEEHGYFISSMKLWRLLSYTSAATYRKARSTGSLPFQEFELDGRKGKFVSTRTVSDWLDKQLSKSELK